MNRFKIALVVCLFFVFIKHPVAFAQRKPITVGLGWNVVDDDGKPYKKLFSFRQSWNLLYYPTRVTVDKELNKGKSVEGILVYNKYKPGKTINNSVNPGTQLFFSGDVMLKFHLNHYMRLKNWFDFYGALGAGCTFRSGAKKKITPTANIGLGFTIWIYPRIGVNAQSLAKFGLQMPIYKTNSNYLHHSLGVVYLIGKKKKKEDGSFVKPRYPWVHRKNKGGEKIR